ncbi:hypothetical protein SAMN04488493_10658 [Xylanibacter ruminicola]|uniref:5-fold beta-flower protein n=1 Tax=Xylanibacter ruminicola TaxID=839 RepID=UPI0008F08316|nr:hypothetical protein [Xylanibacter ruminicola]SFC37628.1 hypothetical protein SAMN04488493_10658 [Xylanibacter ruminicola]
MNRKTSFIALALVAMFACSTPAQAQWGGLLNKARKAAGIKTKQEKAQDAEQQRKDSVAKAAAAITTTIPQAAESGAPIAIKWGNSTIGTWDPVKLEITFNQTYDEGEFAGQKVKYILDPATGKFTSLNGTPKGSISNDGTIESPNLGTIKLDTKTNEVSMDGEVIGSVTKLRASCYGTDFGQLEGHVSPLLVAYIFHGALISKNQVQGWKEAEVKRTEEAKARAAKEKEERAARLEAEKKEFASQRVTIKANNYSTLGYIDGKTVKASNYSTIGYIEPDGTVKASNFSTIGYVDKNGTVKANNYSTIGYFDGSTIKASNYSALGYFQNGNVKASNYSSIGYIEGTKNKTVIAAAIFFFFFKDLVK